jgi:hypothetical protein
MLSNLQQRQLLLDLKCAEKCAAAATAACFERVLSNLEQRQPTWFEGVLSTLQQ